MKLLISLNNAPKEHFWMNKKFASETSFTGQQGGNQNAYLSLRDTSNFLATLTGHRKLPAVEMEYITTKIRTSAIAGLRVRSMPRVRFQAKQQTMFLQSGEFNSACALSSPSPFSSKLVPSRPPRPSKQTLRRYFLVSEPSSALCVK